MDVNRYEATPYGRPRQTAGRHGYVAYFPAPIPRSVELSNALVGLLAETESSLGQLAGVGRLLPDPHLLIRPYLMREALASTAIEGTQTSLAEVYEVEASGRHPDADVEEVLNYVHALEWGLAAAEELPLSVRLIIEIHRRLLAGVRGRERSPGEIRRTQNWVGGAGSTIESALYVPPPPEELGALLNDWERFAHETGEIPNLIRNALLHYQFETLHPFLDGNGRLGRLMSVFLLVQEGRLPSPLLYLSAYLERDRSRYYKSLQAVREKGMIEPWLKLFLEAVQSQAADAVERTGRILDLRERYRGMAAGLGTANAQLVVDLVCEAPIIPAAAVMSRIGVSRPTALRLLRQMEDVGVLEKGVSGPRGQHRYVARELLDLISEGP